ncbi:MAG: HIT family protein [Candidatus Aenigmarchaeota archaeon]|nr:HIT family protein [Candidatus Aenigmarchaeota archaeon]
MDCEFCNPESQGLKIKECRYWTIYLHPNQCYLGRCIIKLNRHAEDFFDIEKNELDEVFEIAKHLRNAVKELFGAAMFNYAALGNIIRHVHLHVIPRYEGQRAFAGIVFEDKRFGDNYAPYDKGFKVPKELLMKLRGEIGSRL